MVGWYDKLREVVRLAERILAARRAQGWSQEELAQQSGLSLRTIQRIENGESKPRLHSLRVLAETLGLPLTDLTEEKSAASCSAEVDWAALWRVNFISALSALLPPLNIAIPLFLQRRLQLSGQTLRASQRIVSLHILWTILLFLAFVVAPYLSLYFTGQVNVGHFPLLLAVHFGGVFVIFLLAFRFSRWIKQENLSQLLRLPSLLGK